MLLIVESPSKCSKIESFIRCKCISSKGHIRELKTLPTTDYDNPTYDIIPEKKSHIESMRKVIKMYSPGDIYLATDDDREGEAIAWHICEIFGLPVETTKRIIFHEVTKQALQKAVATPTTINMNIVKAQKARQVLDVMVGYKISPLLWKYLYRNKDHSLSAGRCQTPALRLVYDNDKECRQAVLKQTYKIAGTFFPKKIEFVLSRELGTKEQVRDFLEASKTFKHEFSLGQKKQVIQPPPRPFSTSGLLQSASSNLGMGPKEVMSLCQQLYQEGWITYMRTDARTYSVEFLEEAKKWILDNRNRPEYVGDIDGLANKDAGNPHEAIRVTHLEQTGDGLAGRAKKLYDFIWKNTIASCMAPAKMEHTSAYMSCPQIEGKLQYVHVIEVAQFLGWKTIFPSSSKESIQDVAFYMSSCPKEQCLIRGSATICVHGAQSHYTEAGLIKKLEEVGIGRPSTYASLVEVLLERGYVKKEDIEGGVIQCAEYVLECGKITETVLEKKVGGEKGKLVIQPTGILVAEFLTENFGPLFEYGYTETMEKDLDKIAGGESTINICESCEEQIDGLIGPIEKKRFVLSDTVEYCVVFGRWGPVIQHTKKREYKSIRVKLDMDRLARGEYTLAELEEKKEETIGDYEGHPVVVSKGPFGEYIQYRGENIGVSALASSPEDSLYDKFAEYMKQKSQPTAEQSNSKIIRELAEGLSIRNGKYGGYIHHQTTDMKKPKFYTLKGFKESYRLCQKEVLLEWIRTTYQIG